MLLCVVKITTPSKALSAGLPLILRIIGKGPIYFPFCSILYTFLVVFHKPLHMHFYHKIYSITVPALPSSASTTLSGRHTTALSPPRSTNSTAASILGPILPGGNCPSLRYCLASSRVSLSSSTCCGVL